MERELQGFNNALESNLQRVIACIESLDGNDLSWRPAAAEANTLYVLAVHIMGNVEENVLGIACGEDIRRDRAAEFAAEGGSAGGLVDRARDLIGRIAEGLEKIKCSDLGVEVEHPRRGRLTAREALLLATRHSAEHVGQMELTRDLLKAARA